MPTCACQVPEAGGRLHVIHLLTVAVPKPVPSSMQEGGGLPERATVIETAEPAWKIDRRYFGDLRKSAKTPVQRLCLVYLH